MLFSLGPLSIFMSICFHSIPVTSGYSLTTCVYKYFWKSCLSIPSLSYCPKVQGKICPSSKLHFSCTPFINLTASCHIFSLSFAFAVVENWKCGSRTSPKELVLVIIVVDCDVLDDKKPCEGSTPSINTTISWPLLFWSHLDDKKVTARLTIHAFILWDTNSFPPHFQNLSFLENWVPKGLDQIHQTTSSGCYVFLTLPAILQQGYKLWQKDQLHSSKGAGQNCMCSWIFPLLHWNELRENLHCCYQTLDWFVWYRCKSQMQKKRI